MESSVEAGLEAIVEEIVRAAQRSLRLRRVILFGSRARGDERADSDIDLAFEHESTDSEWAGFVNQMADEAPTLTPLDLVDLRSVALELRARILREGRIASG